MGAKVMGILRKAGNTFWNIVGDPIGFLSNLISAVGGGVKRFSANIKQHLMGGLIGWLTGAIGDLPIQIPQSLNVKGVLHLGLQVLGATWENIRNKLVKRVGEPLVNAAETSIDIVKKLVTEGPIALWEMLKEKAVEIKESIMGGIQNWVIFSVVKQGIIKVLSFLNPAGALLQAAQAIYNAVMFFVDNAQRIASFVNSIFSSIGKIAAGSLGVASAFIEKAMAQSVPIILNFIARMLNLGSIGKAVKKIIQKIRKPIDKVVGKVIDFVVYKVRKLFGKGAKKKDGKYTEKDRKAAKKAIPTIEKQTAKDGKVSEEEAKRTATNAKKIHPVIKSIVPVIKNKTYDYKVVFRQAEEVKTPLSTEQETEARLNEVVLDKPFKARDKKAYGKKLAFTKEEFRKQIKLQQQSLNNLKVEKWEKNLKKFEEEGRTGTSSASRDRELAIGQEKIKIQSMWLDDNSNNTLEDAKRFVEELFEKQSGNKSYPFKHKSKNYNGITYVNNAYGKSILHGADQIIGGGSETHGLGGARENFSIGAQWQRGKRAERLTEQVRNEAKNPIYKNKPISVNNHKLNIKLPVIDV